MSEQVQVVRKHDLRFQVVHQLRRTTLSNQLAWTEYEGSFRAEVGGVRYTLFWPQGEPAVLIINPPATRAGWYPEPCVRIQETELLDLVLVIERQLGKRFTPQLSDEAENRRAILELAIEELQKVTAGIS